MFFGTDTTRCQFHHSSVIALQSVQLLCLLACSTLCAFLTLLTGPPVLNRLISCTVKQVLIIWAYIHSRSIHLCCQILFTMLWWRVLLPSVSWSKPPPQFDRWALWGSCTKSVLVLLTLSEPPPSRMDRHQRQHQTSCSQRCATRVERAQHNALARRVDWPLSPLWVLRDLSMFAKQHLNFHGTVSTFVRQTQPSLTGAPALALPTPSTPRTVLSTTRERGINADKKGESISMFTCVERDRVSWTRVTQFRVGRSRCSHWWSAFQIGQSCRIHSSLQLLRRVNARNTARMISVTSAFSTAFTSVSWVRAAWLCNSVAASSLPNGATNVSFSNISWAPCCCYWLVSVSALQQPWPVPMAPLCCRLGWLAGFWVVVLNSCSATMCGSKSARVYCGCQPGPTRVALHPGRVVKEPERQPYVRWTTCHEYRGDVDYRRVFLQYCCQIIWSFLGTSSWTGVYALTSPRTIDCPTNITGCPILSWWSSNSSHMAGTVP